MGEVPSSTYTSSLPGTSYIKRARLLDCGACLISLAFVGEVACSARLTAVVRCQALVLNGAGAERRERGSDRYVSRRCADGGTPF